MGVTEHVDAELRDLGPHLQAARRERGLSQVGLATHCGLSQAQISYFEVGQRIPTLDQLLRIAHALRCSLERFLGGADRPGRGLRDIAIELRSLGLVDLWVREPLVPGAFRAPEDVIALATTGDEPDPRVVEAIPAILAWNPISPARLKAYARRYGPATPRRLAWLADVALAVDRGGGFPGGCRKDQLRRLLGIVRAPGRSRRAWDGLGHPMASAPTSPIWRRWRISYDAGLDAFARRARDLLELRGQAPVAGAGTPVPRPKRARSGGGVRARGPRDGPA
jgi:transcriptional regulator with XRE-family HTH domain